MFNNIKNFYKNISKRGVSLVEAIVAIAIISAVTASAITVTMYSNSVYNDSLDRFKARVEADNALASFQYSENKTEFKDSLKAAGFMLNDNGDYIADAYYFNDIKISRANNSIEFRDRNENTIITVADFTDAEIKSFENDFKSDPVRFELKSEVFKSSKNNVTKIMVDYETAFISFYQDASVGWKYYHDGEFYNSKDIVSSYQAEANSAGMEAGNESGTIAEKIKYDEAFNNYIATERNKLFNLLKDFGFSENTRSYTAYGYTVSPYLKTISSVKDETNPNVRYLDFCDADDNVIISKKFDLSNAEQKIAYLEYIYDLNHAGYKEYSSNSYLYSTKSDTRKQEIGLYFYDNYLIQFNQSKSTITAGDLYYYKKSSYAWNPKPSGLEAIFYSTTIRDYSSVANQLQSDSSDDSDKKMVTASLKDNTIYFTEGGTKYYYQGDLSEQWSITEHKFSSDDDFNNAINTLINSNTQPYKNDGMTGELKENNPITVTIDYDDNTVKTKDDFNLIDAEDNVDEQKLATVNIDNFDNYVENITKPELTNFTQSLSQSSLSFPTSFTVQEDGETVTTTTDYQCDAYMYFYETGSWTTKTPHFLPVKTKEEKSGYSYYATTKYYIYADNNGSMAYSIKATVKNVGTSKRPKYETTYEWASDKNDLSSQSDYNNALQSSAYTGCKYTVTVDIAKTQIYLTKSSTKYYYTKDGAWTKTATTLGNNFDKTLEKFNSMYSPSAQKNVHTKSETPKINKTYSCTAKVTATYKDNVGTIVQKFYDEADKEIIGHTSYYNAQGNNQTYECKFTDPTQFNNAVTATANKLNKKFVKSKEEFTAIATHINAVYGTNSFDFYNNDALIYKVKISESGTFKDQQLSFYDTFEYIYKDSIDYTYGIIRYLGRIEFRDKTDTEKNKIVFLDDIGTAIIEFPYDDDARYKEAKKRISDTDFAEFYTLHTNNCSVLMFDPSTPITIDNTNKTITYQKKKTALEQIASDGIISGIIGLISGRQKYTTYYYYGGTDWGTEELKITDDKQWKEALEEANKFYAKMVNVNGDNLTISFKYGSSIYYYSGEGTKWQATSVVFDSTTALLNAQKALKDAYGLAYSEYRDYYVYNNPHYSAHIKFIVNKDKKPKEYYVTLLDGTSLETEIFKETYVDSSEFNEIRDNYESTFIENNNEYVCTYGNYTVTITASFKTLVFSAKVTSKSGKEIYSLHYEKG